MKKGIITLFLCIVALTARFAHASPICPVTSNTNTDCGFILTIGAGGVVTGSPVAGANPYDGNDDALIGVINNSGATYTGSILLSGSGNGGGIFGFDGDGICTYTHAAYCAAAATGYEGPDNTFSNINAAETSGDVVFAGLAAGATSFFSLEGSPQSITLGVPPTSATPEPGSLILLSTGIASLAAIGRRRGSSSRSR